MKSKQFQFKISLVLNVTNTINIEVFELMEGLKNLGSYLKVLKTLCIAMNNSLVKHFMKYTSSFKILRSVIHFNHASGSDTIKTRQNPVANLTCIDYHFGILAHNNIFIYKNLTQTM